MTRSSEITFGTKWLTSITQKAMGANCSWKVKRRPHVHGTNVDCIPFPIPPFYSRHYLSHRYCTAFVSITLPLNPVAPPVGQGGARPLMKSLNASKVMRRDHPKMSHKSWRGLNTVGPQVLQSWGDAVPSKDGSRRVVAPSCRKRAKRALLTAKRPLAAFLT